MKSQIITFLFLIVLINSKSFLKQTCSFSYLDNVKEVAVDPEDILGAAANFAVLAGSTTTNMGVTTIVGNLGVSPGTGIAGTQTVNYACTQFAGGPVSLAAQNSLTTAYNNVANAPLASVLTGTNLAGITLKAGLYHYATSAFLGAGILTLDAEGNSSATWKFQIGSTLITSLGSEVRVINGGNPLNVYWAVGSSATISQDTKMIGNIMAYASIGLWTGATLFGRALARTGQVTMVSNTVHILPCRN
jgi:hypothetical protein